MRNKRSRDAGGGDAVRIYTDGGCDPNPGPGGWGAVILAPGSSPRELSGGEAQTTNNRMELRAAIEALKALPGPSTVALHTDSQYLRNGITRWLLGWIKNDWQTRARTPVKNRDLWVALSGEMELHRVEWIWVRGHSGHRWNERADRLASAAIPRPKPPLEDTEAVHVFTAVAHSPRDGRGGWAALLRFGSRVQTLSGGTTGETANRLHILSAIEGLRALTREVPVHVYTSSDYAKDGAMLWIGGWRKRGWKTADGKSVSHKDLWEALADLQDRLRPSWHVIKRGTQTPGGMLEAKRLATEQVRPRQAET